MESATALAELLMSEPEIVAWLALDDDSPDAPATELEELTVAA